MLKKLFQTSFAPLVATICNVLIAYAVYFLAQGCYFLENYSYFRDTTFSHQHSLCGADAFPFALERTEMVSAHVQMGVCGC